MQSADGKASSGLRNRNNQPVCKWVKNTHIDNPHGIGLYGMDKENIDPHQKFHKQTKGNTVDVWNNDVIDTVRVGHAKMMQVLTSRGPKVKKALGFWADKNYTKVVSFLSEVQDNGVVIDVLPLITEKLKPTEQPLSLEERALLLPVVSRLLHSQYEDYIDKGLDFLIALTKSFKRHEKLKTTEKGDKSHCSIKAMHTELCQIESGVLRQLKLLKDNVGRKAKGTSVRNYFSRGPRSKTTLSARVKKLVAGTLIN